MSEGHNNHTPGRSELDDPDPQGLVDGHAGAGQRVGSVPVGQPGSKERVDFGKIIGSYVDPVTGETTDLTSVYCSQRALGMRGVQFEAKNQYQDSDASAGSFRQ
ncbi:MULTISPECIES: polymorphic toxin type 50 domain-containing protein [unclassified Rhizobium]|nr:MULTISPECIES: polymorphic toxin type 50 domain-containing protein [unclassified Rhizobium]MBB3291282.1 hypothetical protein [Rhizobium sp. BK252]MBB3406023.1 hypothetical protein [Rhizobium sp. BK289]MBB3418604.1 hypothetical protein [Rhizobium sp. BK284]MDK4724231.1 polymorphic toxin type 50 domain-containing protein [Rhizobium sp. CNPSo 3968]